MTQDRIAGYANAVVAVARAEGDLEVVEDELFAVARVFEKSDELREALSDRRIPAARRQQIAEDVLDGRVSEATLALVSMVVAAGRGGDLPSIISAAVDLSASLRKKAVAEVRSAVSLSDEQRRRLGEALARRAKATGKDVTVKVIVDEDVLGGLITRIGDEVIDGSVRTHINQLREAF